ncbi:response regulator, partial [Singulisphaera rosea]
MKVLHVDDDEASRYIVGRILADADFGVEYASTGAEGLQLAASCHPDLIILDVKLPDMDGFEVCRRLKADPSTAITPILHLSAHFVRGR